MMESRWKPVREWILEIGVHTGRVEAAISLSQIVRLRILLKISAAPVQRWRARNRPGSTSIRFRMLCPRDIDKTIYYAQVDYPTFEKKTIEHCVKLVENMVKSCKCRNASIWWTAFMHLQRAAVYNDSTIDCWAASWHWWYNLKTERGILYAADIHRFEVVHIRLYSSGSCGNLSLLWSNHFYNQALKDLEGWTSQKADGAAGRHWKRWERGHSWRQSHI